MIVNSTQEPTTYVSATELTATVPASQLTNGGQLQVSVSDGGAISPSAPGPEVDNPSPAITSASPSLVPAAPGSVVVVITGTGFVPSTVINVNGAARTTAYISSTQVSVVLASTDLAQVGSLSVTAVNAAPGGGASPALSLQVVTPSGIITLFPSTLYVGGASTQVNVNAAGIQPGAVIRVNGVARATNYIGSGLLTFTATAADQSAAASLSVVVTTATGAYAPATLTVAAQRPNPVIAQVAPASLIAGSAQSTINVTGTGLVLGSIVQWNGTNLATSYGLSYPSGTVSLSGTVPASDLLTTGTATVTVNNPGANQPISNSATVTISNPPAPTLTSLNPAGGPINTAQAVTLTGTGFTSQTTVAVNGQKIPSTFVSSTQITATMPTSSVATPGNASVTVTTPAPGGGTTAALVYTAYVSIPNNDIAYNQTDGLLYASVPVTGANGQGNSVVGIDPVTGAITRRIQVGSNPNKLALSTDGTQLFVGLDGSGAVAQVDLTQGKVVNQFSLGGGPGVYNPPYTAVYMAAVPGSRNSVAVTTSGQINGSGVTIYDSGVARTTNLSGYGSGPLAFGTSSTLYLAGGYVEALSVSGTGITGATRVYSPTNTVTTMQYDNGRLYLSSGAVVDVSTSALAGSFYSAPNNPASGPVVSDSTLGRAFVATAPFTGGATIYAFDENSFNLIGSIPVSGLGTAGYPTSFRKIVRWGQNGLAVSGIPSAFTSNNQIFIFQSPLVKDVSSSPADVSASLSGPATASTGSMVSYMAQVSNAGPNPATGVSLEISLDSSLIAGGVVTSQGSCAAGTSVTCDLGTLASGASVTVTVSTTPTSSGILAATAVAATTSFDPSTANNQSTGSTVVSGAVYGAIPSISSISPNLVQAGSSDFTLTINGAGFNANSTVNLGPTALATTVVSATKLTATVTAAAIAKYGWAAIQVVNPPPGGGVSAVTPLTIYGVVNLPATSILFDPYSQSLYATLPANANSQTGNSVVSINPFTGTAGTPVAVGSQPTVMSETSDGNYLYIGLTGANSLVQFNLMTQSVTATIPLTYSSSGIHASSLASMPGSDTTLAIGLGGSTWGEFGIFDVTGNTGAFRSKLSGIYEGVNPAFASPTELYAYDSQTSGAEFYRYQVNSTGLSLMDGTTLNGMGGFSGGFASASGLVYGGGGGIANPNTTPPSQIATLPLIDFYNAGITGYGVGVTPDPSLQKEFMLLENTAGTWAYALARYDLNTYLPEAILNMPAAASGVDSNWSMFRFGQDGLAMLSYNTLNTPAVSQVILLRGPFVAPQELGTSTAASLSSSSASTIAHGSGNTILTLLGSNFLPGVAVTWNGSYRTTTVVDPSHVTVTIPAGDLASAGSASVVATNPGSPASNTLQITIN